MSIRAADLLPSPGTTSKIMRHYRHVLPPKKTDPIPKSRSRRTPGSPFKGNHVKEKDRIKYWNLVPGDIVKTNTGWLGGFLALGFNKKVRAEGKVHSIDRERNLLWLDPIDTENARIPVTRRNQPVRISDPSDPEKGYTPSSMLVRRPVHYSNLMIQVPSEDAKNPIWTSHIIRKKVRYDRDAQMFKWDRIAVFKDANGKKIQRKVPWPKEEIPVLSQQPDVATISVVQEESWVPWDPKDPILLPSQRPRDSPLSAALVVQQMNERLRLQQEQNEGVPDEVRTRTMSQLQEALKSGDAKAITAALNAAAALQRSTQGSRDNTRGPNSTYAGFKSRSKPKPIPVAQLPSAAELLDLRKDALQHWFRSNDVAAHIEQGGSTFAQDDYLRLAPHAGPLVGHMWRSPITRPSSTYYYVTQPPRHSVTGQIRWDPDAEHHMTSQRHLDSMPIEVLMERDLTNPNNQKQRTKRYKERKEAEKQARLQQETKNRENLELFKKYVLAKKQKQDAAAQAQAGAA